MIAKVYLSGSIDGLSNEEKHAWREAFKSMYGAEYCLDPTRRCGEGNSGKDIVELDLIDMAAADVILVYLTRYSPGTLMEIVYGFRILHKMVIIVHANKDLNISCWIKNHCHRVFETLQDAKKYIDLHYNIP